MKTFNGYKKKNLTDSNLLLAGSGHKPLNELLTDLSRPTNTNKISITVGGNTLQLDLGARAWDSTSYLPLTGGTMTGVISKSGVSVSWYQGRLSPIIKTTSYTGYNSILSMKTTNGSWDLGVYTSDTAYLTYITDANHNANNNTTTYQLTFPKATGTLALTSQLENYLPLSGGTLSGKLTFAQDSTVRDRGIIGYYDPNRAAAIWSMGSSYLIKADGTTFGSLYGAAYAYFGSGYTFGAGYSNGHSLVWCLNGTIYAALGDAVWSRGGFIKNGSSDNYALTGAGGHFAIHTGRNNSANALVRTDGNGYILCGYINSSSGDENNNSSPARVWGTNGSDSYLRTYRTSALSVNYANYSAYLPTKYDGGQKTNPQTYFNYNIGVRVAMTGSWSVWSDTLWINGYSGSDVRNMCALHFLRNGTPRMAITTQRADATAYGTYYEVITTYNVASHCWPLFTDSYPCLRPGSSNNWILIGTSNSSYGIIPSTSGSAGNGHNYIGTSSWYWKYAYIDEMYGHLNGSCTGSAGSVAWANVSDGTHTSTASGWSKVQANTYGGSAKSYFYMCHGGGYGAHIRGYSTSSSVYMLLVYNSSKEVFGVYGDGHSNFGGNVNAPNYYTTSDARKKQNISLFSEHIRKFQLKDTEKWHYGVIAQEVPEMFRDGKEGNMTVNYNSVLSYYIGQLENKVKELENKIKQLENNG